MSPILWQHQIDFLRVISCHEHFVALNLPQYGPSGITSGASSPTPSLRSIDSAGSFISTMMGDRYFNFYDYGLLHLKVECGQN